MNRRYPLAKPDITQKEIAAVTKILQSGVLSIGPAQEEFERRFAAKVGTKYAVAVSSGTAGLHLCMLAAKIGSEEEVITTPFSFVASANVILYVGAKPIFADIDPLTYNIDPKKIEEKITPKTKALLVVHIFGQAADMDPIIKIAKKHNLKIIEDACESLGATYHGKKVGTFGESAVFAFYPNKQITTGEGGMIVTNNKEIYELGLSLRNQGRSQDMQWLEHERLGYNYRMDEMSAALGLAQLKRLDKLIQKRQTLAKIYERNLSPFPEFLQTPQTPENNSHTWFLYVVRLKNASYRDSVIRDLYKLGIESKSYLPSIHLLKFYRDRFGFREGNFPISEKISKSTLALPFHTSLKENDVKHIVKQLIKIIQNYDK